jgi:hypothetical protein
MTTEKRRKFTGLGGSKEKPEVDMKNAAGAVPAAFTNYKRVNLWR